jgi:hypothetical protein
MNENAVTCNTRISMTKRISILALLVAFVVVDANAQNRTHRRRGVILGGLAGAAIGAAIGDKGDNETAGALIGGAVGAVAGGTIGNQKDQRIEHNRRYHSGHYHGGQQNYVQPYPGASHGPYQQYYQPYYAPQVPAYPHVGYGQAPLIAPAEPTPLPITPQDVVEMVRSGLSERMIIQQIEIQGVQQRLTVSDVIRLHQLGVSEPIIIAMQEKAPIATSPEVIIEPTSSYRIPTKPHESFGPSIVAPANGR